jgi:hypothetical protein
MSQLRQLIQKEIDGTLTDAERDELEMIVREWSRHNYEECPACGGAFTSDVLLKGEVRCPQCDTLLKHFSSDMPGHDFAEIDVSLAPEGRLGVFTVGYTIPGTIPCLRCGVVFPKKYTCCPKLFTTAVELHYDGTDSQRRIVLQFMDSHAETLLNSLRGRFVECFRPEVRNRLSELAPQLICGDALQGILAKVGT